MLSWEEGNIHTSDSFIFVFCCFLLLHLSMATWHCDLATVFNSFQTLTWVALGDLTSPLTAFMVFGSLTIKTEEEINISSNSMLPNSNPYQWQALSCLFCLHKYISIQKLDLFWTPLNFPLENNGLKNVVIWWQRFGVALINGHYCVTNVKTKHFRKVT